MDGQSFKTCKHAIPGKIQRFQATKGKQKPVERRQGSSSAGARTFSLPRSTSRFRMSLEGFCSMEAVGDGRAPN
jgi:hypothetical protein